VEIDLLPVAGRARALAPLHRQLVALDVVLDPMPDDIGAALVVAVWALYELVPDDVELLVHIRLEGGNVYAISRHLGFDLIVLADHRCSLMAKRAECVY
jgi:hypothetical protein